jgi:hypothetical protein
MSDGYKHRKVVYPELVGSHFHLVKKIGGGSFGEIFKTTMNGSSDIFAAKLEVEF